MLLRFVHICIFKNAGKQSGSAGCHTLCWQSGPSVSLGRCRQDGFVSARPGMERNAQDNHLPGEVQLSAGPSVEDAGAVGVLRDADIVVPGGQDGKYVHMGAHFPSVFQVEDIVLLFMLEKAPRKDGDGVSCSTIELPPVSRQMGVEPITTRS